MVIKVTPKFTKAQIEGTLRKRVLAVHQAYLERLENAGLEFIKIARSKTKEDGGFKDQTGNLRNSIGYVIMKDGKQIIGDFKVTAKGNPSKNKDGADGVEVGKRRATEIAGKYPQGYVLICVAGMHYAAAVESKNKDVITGSSLIVKQMLIKAIEEAHNFLK